MPRIPKAAEAAAIQSNTLVVDNGGWSIKAGLVAAQPSVDSCHTVPNCIGRDQDRQIYVGAQLDRCRDYYHVVLRRPVERGMVVSWELERAIWHQSFLSEKEARIKCDPHETNLVLTESPNVFPALQANCDQIVFEEFEFASYFRCIGPRLNAYSYLAAEGSVDAVSQPAQCLLVVDSGFSHTTVTPVVDGRPVHAAIRRLDVGGKHLTNYLAELLAIHEISLKEDPWIANELKEAVCYVSDDFKRDMERTWRGHRMDPSIVVDCQLPDYQEISNVVVKPYEAKDPMHKTKFNITTVGNERFQVPEILFNPSDVGMAQAGLPGLIVQSISALPEGLRPAIFENIFAVGGNSKIPGYMKRLAADVRQLAPAECKVRITSPDDPIKSTWLGGARMATDEASLREHLVSRQQYLEHGSNWLLRRFNGQE